jgi:hypothetical protein
MNCEEAIEEMATELTEAVMRSESVVKAIYTILQRERPSPASIIFSACILDEFLDKHIPEWSDTKHLVISAWKHVQQSGAILDFTNCCVEGSKNDVH